MDVAGTSTSQFGRINISGAAALAGTCDLAIVGGFTPVEGQTFQVLTFGSRTGEFDTVTGTDLGGGLEFDVQYNATNVTLAVVPAGSLLVADTDPADLTTSASSLQTVDALAEATAVEVGKAKDDAPGLLTAHWFAAEGDSTKPKKQNKRHDHRLIDIITG